MRMIYAVALAVSLVFSASASLLIKAGARAIEAQHQAGAGLSTLAMIKAGACSPWILGAMACGALHLATYAFALRKLPINVAYPILGSVGFGIVVVGAAVWFSEKLNGWQIVGVGITLVGVWVMASQMGKTA